MNIKLRPALPSDSDAITDLYLASRKTFQPYASLVHSDDAVRHWIANVLIASGAVTAALDSNQIVGMMATSRQDGIGWIDQFFMAPDYVGKGIGTRLLDHTKTTLGSPIRLVTFQANSGARRFYERHGFVSIAFSDGQDNEEKCPDVFYEWTAPA